MPEMRAIDMRRDPAGNRWISPSLQAAVDARIERGEQALLFINRRGYAPVTLCRACGIRWAAITAMRAWSSTVSQSA